MKRKTTSRRQTQLDRIENKLDELLRRPPTIVQTPGTWNVPITSPGVHFVENEPRPLKPPTDIWGNPAPYW